MRHPTDGTLRRLLDEPAGVADADREHVAGCRACLSALEGAQQDAMMARRALLAAPGADPARHLDVDLAWAQLSQAVAAGAHRPSAATTSRSPRWRKVLRSPAVAALGVAAVLAGAGAAAAADWLPIFRTERVAPVALTEADLVALPDLSAYGDLELRTQPHLREVADAGAAGKATGLAVPQVAELPPGAAAEPALPAPCGPGPLTAAWSSARSAGSARSRTQGPPGRRPGWPCRRWPSCPEGRRVSRPSGSATGPRPCSRSRPRRPRAPRRRPAGR